MFHYADLIWTGMATIGGFLLLSGQEDKLNRSNWLGVWCVFVGFIIQACWEFIATNDWFSVAVTEDMILAGLAGMLLGRLRRRSKTANDKQS